MKLTLSYDDINLVPKYSEVKTRQNVDLKTKISKNYELLIPIIASPMDTVCGEDMAFKMFTLGGIGCIHRFYSIEEQSNIVKSLITRIYNEDLSNWKIVPVMAAIGVQNDDKIRAVNLTKAGANIILIDVAHGHHINVINMIKWCKQNLSPNVDVIAGNIATKEAAIDLQNAGADGLRAGIGGGSLCTTRIKTGFGVPNVSSLFDIIESSTVPVIADGGIRSSGDIAKALAIGASTVMIGSIIAGTDEAPGKIIETPTGLFKRYRGSASLETKLSHNMKESNVEGESTFIPYKGGVKFIVNGLIDGLKSALSYGGANNLNEFYPEIIQVTNNGLIEGKPHLIK